MSEAWLVRHGETEWSAEGRHTGRTDIPLTDAGKTQAKLLAKCLGGKEFARVLTSPARRARETCELAELGRTAEVVEDLAEWNYGAYEGRATADIRADRPGWLLWTDGAPGGESANDVGRRLDRVVENIRATDGDVVVFGHGHSLRVLAARWLGLPPEDGRYFALSTATISVLGYEREVAVILRWNEPAEASSSA